MTIWDRNRIGKSRAFEKPAKTAEIDNVEGYVESLRAPFSISQFFLVTLSIVERQHM